MRSVEISTRVTMGKRRNFVNYATMTLSDGTILNLTPSDFRIGGNSFTDDWCEGDAFQIGSAIGKTATLMLDNTDGRTELNIDSDIYTNRGYYTKDDVYNTNDYVLYKSKYWGCLSDNVTDIEPGTDDSVWEKLQTVTYKHGKFSQYDFYMAYFTLYVVLPEAYTYEGELRDEVIPIGVFTVTNPVSNGATIEIEGVDNMYMFDKSFDECTLDFTHGVNLLTILNKCCEDCGVAIGYTTFDNSSITVNEKPEGATYRQIVSYIAQIAGCNAVISNTGALQLKWYDMSTLDGLDGGIFDEDNPYSTGDDADGGSFNPWNLGYVYDGGQFSTPLRYHNLYASKNTQVSTDDITITNVKVKIDDAEFIYPSTEGNYVMEISENPFITADTAEEIIYSMYAKLANLHFRPFSNSVIQDPTIEAGDCAFVYDVKGNVYKTIITNVSYTTGGYTNVSANASPPIKQNSRYINPAAQAVAQSTKKMDDYNKQVAHFNELANQALGYYKTTQVDQQTGSNITFIHNHPTLETSDIQWKITSTGIFISEDYGQSWNNGYDASTGTMLMNLVYAHGITADWIRTGTLEVGGSEYYNDMPVFKAYTQSSEILIENISQFTTRSFRIADFGTTEDSKLYIYVNNVSAGGHMSGRALIQRYNGTDFDILDRIYLSVGINVSNITLEYSSSDAYWISLYPNDDGSTYTTHVYVHRLNTTIDSNGITTSDLHATGGIVEGSIIQGSVIQGDSSFLMEVSSGATLKFGNGAAWPRNLVLTNASTGGGFDVCRGASSGTNSVDVHYNDVRKYDSDGNPTYAQFGSSSSSDIRLKENIKDANLITIRNLFEKLSFKTFNYISDDNKNRHYGIIAQELITLLNNLGIDTKDFIGVNAEGFYEVYYSSLARLNLMATKDLYNLVNQQQLEINSLHEELNALKKVVNNLAK